MAALEPPLQVGGTDLLTAALAYAQRGWAVFPLHSPGRTSLCDCGDEACTQAAKHPRISAWQKNASINERQIRDWWRKWPRANIGIACGKSSLVVLDVDPRHGGDRALSELAKRHSGERYNTEVVNELVATLASETGGGGEHYVYRAPLGVNIRNAANLDSLAGLDVRGDGGYFVAAPSLHVSGARYQWRDGATEPGDVPAWLVPVLTRRNSQPLRASVRVFAPPRSVAESSAYWLERALHLAHEGNRNDRGFWLACQLRDSGLPQAAAEQTLDDYAARAPGAGYTQREALNSVRSAYKGAPRDSARSAASMAAASPQSAYRDATPPTEPDVAYGATSASAASRATHAPADARPRFTFLTDEECENMPPPAWLVDGLLVQGQRSMIFGEPGSYKSFLALDLALCIATGSRWHGHATSQGRVVYIAGEGKGGLGKRIKAWKLYHGYVGSAPISILGEAAQLLHGGDVTALIEAIQALPEPPVAIIFDTLARAVVGGDENSAQDMGQAIAAIDFLHNATDAHVMVIHHKARGAKNARGSTAVPGGMDTMIDLSREQGVVTMHCEKQKESAEFADLKLTFLVTLQADNLLETSGVLVPTNSTSGPQGARRRPIFPAAMLQALAIIREATRLTHADWQQRFTERSGQTQRSFGNHLHLLEVEGMVVKRGDFWEVTSQGESYSPGGDGDL